MANLSALTKSELTVIGLKVCPFCQKQLRLHRVTLTDKGLEISTGKEPCSFKLTTRAYHVYSQQQIDIANELYSLAVAYFYDALHTQKITPIKLTGSNQVLNAPQKTVKTGHDKGKLACSCSSKCSEHCYHRYPHNPETLTSCTLACHFHTSAVCAPFNEEG